MKLHYSHVTRWWGNWLNCVWWKWAFSLPRSVWPERGKNQHGRLLRRKLEQKLGMELEEVEYMHAFMVDGNWDFSVEESLFNEHIVRTI